MQRGLEAQLKEKEQDRLSTRRMDKYYGKMLKEKDDIDIQNQEDERSKRKRQQDELFLQLQKQTKENNEKSKFGDMMSEQERMMNIKKLEAYQYGEPLTNFPSEYYFIIKHLDLKVSSRAAISRNKSGEFTINPGNNSSGSLNNALRNNLQPINNSNNFPMNPSKYL